MQWWLVLQPARSGALLGLRYGIDASTALAEPPPDRAMRSALHSIDWRAARRAGRACCCPAQPAVIAVIPRPGRPHASDLLLCGHHYRVSRQALQAVGAVVLDMDGVPAADRPWPLAGARR